MQSLTQFFCLKNYAFRINKKKFKVIEKKKQKWSDNHKVMSKKNVDSPFIKTLIYIHSTSLSQTDAMVMMTERKSEILLLFQRREVFKLQNLQFLTANIEKIRQSD